MTETLAKQVFDTLIERILENGFTDIITFAIPEASENFRHSTFNDEYTYSSTNTELQNLIILANSGNGGAKRALDSLVTAALEYFLLAGQIPERYRDKIIEVSHDTESKVPLNILMNTIADQNINIGLVLESDPIKQIIGLLRFIDNNSEQPDETFLKDIEDF